MGFRHLLFWPELPPASRLEPARLCPPQLRALTLASRPEPTRLCPPQPRQPSVHLRSLAAQFWAQREWPALPRQQLRQDQWI